MTKRSSEGTATTTEVTGAVAAEAVAAVTGEQQRVQLPEGFRVVFERGNSYLAVYTIPESDMMRKVVDNCVCEALQGTAKRGLTINLYGKEVEQPRAVGFVADPEETEGYLYSRKLVPSQEPTNSYKALVTWVNNKLGTEYNGTLINCYTPNDCIGRHGDNERDLDKSMGVVALSVGMPREFIIRDAKEKSNAASTILCRHLTGDYEVMIMGGDFQKELTHEIPRMKEADRVADFVKRQIWIDRITLRTGITLQEPTRVSFTFRCHKKAPASPSSSSKQKAAKKQRVE